ncbi:DBH-like monooxygenase protein 1 [Centruroides vittatus]|uniref:DBH-like monooxygenase protein 1 n=1 Tax=Centruroides vittatus TaxID=120091 RepID=UPI00350F1AFE
MSMCKISTFLALIILVRGQEWVRQLVLDPYNKYRVGWWITDGIIGFQVEVATRGWIGFGISRNGQMADSDVVIGWVNDGNAILQDRHINKGRKVLVDSQQDWILDFGEENETHTKLRFHRRLMTCDNDDLPIDDSMTHLIYAYHREDPAFDRIPVRHYPHHRGSKKTILLQGNQINLIRKNYSIWEILAPNNTIPKNKDTTYLCTLFRVPYVGRKRHVFEIEPIIQKGNEQFVNHIVLYKCLKIRPKTVRPYLNNKSYNCYYPDMPDIFSNCQTVLFSWALGGESFILPKHVGLPFGGKDGIFFLLEIHYDNPNLMSGIVDHSGLRLYYTTHLRKFDAMTLVVGAVYEPCVIIPPNDDNFIVAGHGDPKCLSPAIPANGIKIFAVSLHMHLLGRKFVLRHFRGNKELQPIVSEKNYDYYFQEYHYLQKEVTVLATDHLVAECTYNSIGRNITTFGGLGTKDEMCLAFILYYPKIARSFAISAPSCNLVVGLAGVEKNWPESEILESPLTKENQTFLHYLATYPWRVNYIDIMEETIRYSPHLSTCIFGNSTRIIMNSHVTYPVNFTSYPEADCSNAMEKCNYFCKFCIIYFLAIYFCYT